MSYLISLFGLASIGSFLACVMFSNGVFGLLSIAMLTVCLVLCILDALITVNRGAKKNLVFNWVASSRSIRRPEDDGSYYDV